MVVLGFIRLVPTFAALALLAVGVTAASLDDYRSRVGAAQSSFERLVTRSATAAESPEAFAADIKRLIPASERVEWETGSIETDNHWLHAELDELATAPRETREEIAIRISQRLTTLAMRLAGEAAVLPITKDDQKQKLAEILARQEYQKPEPKGESTFQRWWREFMEWLAQFAPRPEMTPAESNGLGSLQFVLQIIVFGLVFLLIAFLVYKFAPLLGRRAKNKKESYSSDRVILGERISADESSSSLFAEAETLAAQGNIRGAIRKGYIALLCELSDRKLLKLGRHKTNHDYLRDLRGQRNLHQQVGGLTSSFELNWYGLRPARSEDWQSFRDGYDRALAQVERRGR